MPELPKELREALARGRLTRAQLRQLITLEARALRLTYAQALKRARARTLPKNAIGTDLARLVDLLSAA
jgi:hypothetical protein